MARTAHKPLERPLRRLKRESPQSPYVFVNERGALFTAADFRKMAARVGEAVGFNFGVHPRTLRHACLALNAARATRAAGFAKSSGNVQGHRMRRKPHVAEAISKALAERLDVMQNRIIEEVSRLAFSNIGDVLTIEDGKLVVKDHAALDRTNRFSPS